MWWSSQTPMVYAYCCSKVLRGRIVRDSLKKFVEIFNYMYNCTTSLLYFFPHPRFTLWITRNFKFSIFSLVPRYSQAGAKTQPSERWWWRWRGTKRSKNGASILHRLSRSVAKVPRGGGRCRGETSVGEKMRNVAGGPGLMDILTYTPDYLPPHAARNLAS